MKKYFIVILLVFLVSSILFSTGYSTKLESKLAGTTGLLSGIFLVQSYIIIGMCGDVWEKNAYDVQSLNAYLTTTKRYLNLAKKYYQEVSMMNVPQGDYKFFVRLDKTCDLLLGELTNLVNYMKTKEKKYADDFQKYRKSAWAEIRSIIGLDKKNK